MTSMPGRPDLTTCNVVLRILEGTAGHKFRQIAVHCAPADMAPSDQRHSCGRAGPLMFNLVFNSTLTADKMRP